MRHFLYRPFVFFTVCFSFIISGVQAQVQISPRDTVICNGSAVTLHAVNGAGVPVSTALTSDDIYSPVIPIGFSFTYFGTAYTQCQISSNGYITFNSYTPGSGSAYNPNGGGGFPGNTNTLNSIMGCWMDWDPSVAGSGSIDYATTGTAPNRKFVVTFCDIPFYLTACNSIKGSMQMVLIEGTNAIEVHLNSKPVCLSWPNPYGGAAVEGIQNAAGTIAFMVPGRENPQVPWTANHSSHRWTPTSATAYTLDSIAFNPVSVSGGGLITWYDSTNTILGTGPNLIVNPTVSGKKYFARQIYCSDTTTDSTRVFIGNNPTIDSVQATPPSYCGNNDGSLKLFGLPPNQNLKVDYSKNGIPQTQILQTSAGNGTMVISNLSSGVYTNIRASTATCLPGNQRGPISIIDPRIAVNFTSSVQAVCDGNDIVTFTNTTPFAGPTNYEWRFGDGQTASTTSPVHTYVNQGNYEVTLVADNGTCRDTINLFVDTRHPLDAFFLVDHENACQFQTLNFKDSSIITAGNGPQPTYSWDFGDNTTGSGTTVTHAYQTVGVFTARLIVTDFVPCADTFYRTITVGVPPVISFVSSASTVCEGLGATYTADFSTEIPVGYEWHFGDSTVIYNTNPVSHAYDSAGTYEVKLIAHYRYCPDTNYTLPITVTPFPGINIGPDTALCPGSSAVTLYNRSDLGNYPGATYAWTTGATTPSITVNTDGTYGATINYNGCTASDSMTVFKDCYLDVPNSFTPNGDGLNDYFLPRQFLGRGVTGFKMSVFNRWGQTVFESTALDGRGWDGKFNNAVQPAGVYIYIIDVFFTNGTKEHYTGNVTMIR